jgi:hypothetical protein
MNAWREGIEHKFVGKIGSRARCHRQIGVIHGNETQIPVEHHEGCWHRLEQGFEVDSQSTHCKTPVKLSGARVA